MTSPSRLLFLAVTAMLFACAPAEEATGESGEELSLGVYVARATTISNGGYIGDWEHDWGYVLGYATPGMRVYAHTVRNGSVYGLITNGHYGAWDHGHHCGWIMLEHLKGKGFHSSAADVCPPPDNDFSLARGSNGPTGFKKGTWTECNGCVQRAVVLPTCSDFTVYANYDPVTHTFHDPDGVEVAGRGTIDGAGPYMGVPGVPVTQGYSGFGTRFVTSDDFAVEIKDTRRACNVKGGCTAFGFMHADCIGGELVGNMKGSTPAPTTPMTACGDNAPGAGLVQGRAIASCNNRYFAEVQTDGNFVWRDSQQSDAAIWATNTSHTDGTLLLFQTDGNLVLYDGNQNALWSTHTQGSGATRLALQDDGNIVLYDGNSSLVWSSGTAGK